MPFGSQALYPTSLILLPSINAVALADPPDQPGHANEGGRDRERVRHIMLVPCPNRTRPTKVAFGAMKQLAS